MRLKFLESGYTSKNYRNAKIQIPSFMLAKTSTIDITSLKRILIQNNFCVGEDVARTEWKIFCWLR
jgi:hypothetical protein